MPDYDLTQYNKVKVTLYGRVLNEKYTEILFKNPDMDLETVFLLDKVQKHENISQDAANYLREKKLIEGRRPNLYIAASVAESLNKKAEYVKNKGFTDKYYKDLIIKYLTEWNNRK